MRKRILCIAVCLVLTLGIIPSAAFTGPDAIDTWAELQAAISKANADRTVITLSSDLTANASDAGLTIRAGQNVTLDLNGHILDRGLSANGGAAENASHGSVIEVLASGGAAVLTVTDSDPDASHPGYVDASGLWHRDERRTHELAPGETEKTVFGGIITGGTGTVRSVGSAELSFGGGVFLGSGCRYTLGGGTVAGNAADNGGGIYAEAGSTLRMSGGSAVEHNAAASDGGGVFLAGTMLLEGGTLGDDSAERGGGLFIDTGATEKIFAGSAVSGHSAVLGGGIYNSGELLMYGGAVSDNRARDGGGVYNMGTFLLTGGELLGNVAENGGAIYAEITKTLSMTGGVIAGNVAENGGALFCNILETCLGKGTRISMADGTTKPIEDVERGEDVLVFDHETGTVGSAPAGIVLKQPEPVSRSFTLRFADGASVTVVGGRGFYSREENRYVNLNYENAERFLGQEFYKPEEGSWAALTGVERHTEPAEAYVLVTEGALNCVAEGLLSCEDSIVTPMCNVFDFDENLTVDPVKKQADIDRWKLTERAEFPEFPEEFFNAYPFRYAKVAVGKGLVSEAELRAVAACYYGLMTALSGGNAPALSSAQVGEDLPVDIHPLPSHVIFGGKARIIGNMTPDGEANNVYLKTFDIKSDLIPVYPFKVSAYLAVGTGPKSGYGDDAHNGVAVPEEGMLIGVNADMARITEAGSETDTRFFFADDPGACVIFRDGHLELAEIPDGKNRITVSYSAGGVVWPDRQIAADKETVTLQIFSDPEADLIPGSLKAILGDGSGRTITPTATGNPGEYAFAMPDCPVTVTAEFAGASHTHSFVYTASGTVLTATCENADCTLPEKDAAGNGYVVLTLTPPAPEDLIYNGNAKSADYGSGEAAAWIFAVGSAAPDILYYLEDGTTPTSASNSGASVSGGAPAFAGKYTAKATAGGAKAELAFTVTKASQPDLTVTMDGYTYGGTVGTPGLNGAVKESAAVTYYYSASDVTTGGTEWTGITGTTLDAGTYYLYAVFGATKNYNGTTTAAATAFTIAKADQTAPDEGEGYSINGSLEITVATGYEVSAASGDFSSPIATGTTLNDGQTYYVRKAETTNFNASPETSFTAAPQTHVHDLIITVSGAVLSATCKNADCTLPHKDAAGNGYAALTLTSPAAEDLIYNGNAKSVFYGSGEAAALELAGLEVPDILYYLEDGATPTDAANSGAAGDGKAPVYAGKYVAKATAEGKTAVLTFTVAKADQTAPAVTMSDYTYGGTVSTPGLNGAVKESAAVTYYYSETNVTTGGTEWTGITGTTLDAGDYHLYAVIGETANYNGTTTAATAFTVAKASQPALSVTMSGYTYGGTPGAPGLSGAVKESATVTYYYSASNVTTGGTEWTGITGTTLDAGTYYLYAVIGETTNYGETTTATTAFTVAKADQTAPAADEGYSISSDMKITVTAGYEVSAVSGDFSSLITTGTTLTDGKTYYVRKAETTNFNASPATPFIADSSACEYLRRLPEPKEGKYTLKLGNTEIGTFIFVRNGNGWTIRAESGLYLGADNGILGYRVEPFAWSWDGKAFYVNELIHIGGFRLGPIYFPGVPVLKKLYPTALGAPLSSDFCASSVWETVTDEDGHKFGGWVPDGTGMHTRTCANCGKTEKESCKYDGNVCIICGGHKPGSAFVTVEVREETRKKPNPLSILFPFLPTESETVYTIFAQPHDTSVLAVEYSLDGGRSWTRATTFAAKKPASFEIRVRNTSGGTQRFTYANGKVTENKGR